MAVVTRFLQSPAQSFFLFGPRDGGKSTWLAQAFPRSPLDTTQEIEELALETLLTHHLRAFSQFRHRGYNLSFQRTRSVLEVDFVMYGPDLFWAIEVKRSARIDKHDPAGFKAVCVDYPQAKRILLSFAPETLRQLQPNNLKPPKP